VGVSSIAQTTLEAVECIRCADKVFYVVNDPVAAIWLKDLNRTAQSFSDLYAPDKPRHLTYAEMAAHMIDGVTRGLRVCAVFYGHPGVLVQASHVAIRRVKALGYRARMLPGISTDACMYCDLAVNPGEAGIQSFETTNFLLRKRRVDPTAGLILWQAGVLGESTARRSGECDPRRIRYLVRRLRRDYPARHRITIYRAPAFPDVVASICRVPLEQLTPSLLTPLSTLYIPPIGRRRSADRQVAAWLRQRLPARIDRRRTTRIRRRTVRRAHRRGQIGD
jgi:uncharacterized protein YabN with tetrapyrrole methylase and pyrophosphatase domain